jgi:hypothetical protein
MELIRTDRPDGFRRRKRDGVAGLREVGASEGLAVRLFVSFYLASCCRVGRQLD